MSTGQCPIRVGRVASPSEIGRRVQTARRGLEWSTADLSAQCHGLTVTQLERIEAGNRVRVSLHEAVVLAAALRVEFYSLVCQEVGVSCE